MTRIGAASIQPVLFTAQTPCQLNIGLPPIAGAVTRSPAKAQRRTRSSLAVVKAGISQGGRRVAWVAPAKSSVYQGCRAPPVGAEPGTSPNRAVVAPSSANPMTLQGFLSLARLDLGIAFVFCGARYASNQTKKNPALRGFNRGARI